MEKVGAASESGAAVGGEDSGQSEGVVSQAKEKIQTLASKAQQEVAAQATSVVDRGKQRAVDVMGGLSQALLLSSQHLHDQNEEAVGRYVAQAADRVEQASRYLREADVRELMGDVENVARRQPGLFLAGAFAVGLLAARFLKSSKSSQQRNQGGAAPRWAGTEDRGRAYSGSFASERDVTARLPAGAVTDQAWRSPPL